MQIKQQGLFVAGLIAGAFFLYFITDRVWFVTHSDRTGGQVESLSKRNATCGTKRSRHPCTHYSALVSYAVGDWRHSIEVTAGSTRGHDQPYKYADYVKGSAVPIVYERGHPDHAYRDTFWDVWGAPLISFFFQIAMLLGSTQEPRNRRGLGVNAGSRFDISFGDFSFGD